MLADLKRTRLLLAGLVLTAAPLVISCGDITSSDDQAEIDSSVPVSVESGEARLTISRDKAERMLRSKMTDSGHNVSRLDSIWAIGGPSGAYVAGRISQSDSTCLTYAVGSGTDCDGEEEHSCSGSPCTSCDFTEDDGEITGCECNDDSPEAYCNHTVRCVEEK